jgi:hypothetical protein
VDEYSGGRGRSLVVLKSSKCESVGQVGAEMTRKRWPPRLCKSEMTRGASHVGAVQQRLPLSQALGHVPCQRALVVPPGAAW